MNRNQGISKQKYLEDGNEDWEKVLDFNPLPNSINFKLKKIL
jgi:cell division transport system permease protein